MKFSSHGSDLASLSAKNPDIFNEVSHNLNFRNEGLIEWVIDGESYYPSWFYNQPNLGTFPQTIFLMCFKVSKKVPNTTYFKFNFGKIGLNDYEVNFNSDFKKIE